MKKSDFTINKKQILRLLKEELKVKYLDGTEKTIDPNQKIDSNIEPTKDTPEPQKNIFVKTTNCKPKYDNYEKAANIENDIIKGDIIKIGQEGESVVEIQTYLIELGLDLGKCKIDGFYGASTKSAVEEFQKEEGLSVTGEVNQKTLSRLSNPVKFSFKEVVPKKSEEKKPIDKKTEEKKSEVKKVDKGSYDEYRYSNYRIYIPKNYKSIDAHVLFCGSHTEEGTINSLRSLYTEAVNPLLNRVAVVITHSYHSGPFDGFVDIVQNFLNKNGFKLKITTIAGFSRGGNVVWQHANSNTFKFVGLIDPSTFKKRVGPVENLKLGSNDLLVCNPNNWGGEYVETRKNLKILCSKKDTPEFQGKVICVKKSHNQIMESFYYDYGYRI